MGVNLGSSLSRPRPFANSIATGVCPSRLVQLIFVVPKALRGEKSGNDPGDPAQAPTAWAACIASLGCGRMREEWVGSKNTVCNSFPFRQKKSVCLHRSN